MWQVIRNTTFHTITPAVAVAMGTGRLRLYASDCLSSALCLSARGRGLIWGVFMCAVTQQLPPPGRGRGVVRLLCETWNRSCPSSSQRLRQYRLYSSSEARIVRLERICAVTPASLPSRVFFFFPFSLLEVENWRGLHMIPVWSCFCEVLSFCEDVKRNRHQNLNVDARRDASVRLLFFFLSSWIIISYLSH